jgi:hypothetical protein
MVLMSRIWTITAADSGLEAVAMERFLRCFGAITQLESTKKGD